MFIDRTLQVGVNIYLESHHINHANSKLTIIPNFPEYGIELQNNNKTLKELATIYSRILNYYELKNQKGPFSEIR